MASTRSPLRQPGPVTVLSLALSFVVFGSIFALAGPASPVAQAVEIEPAAGTPLPAAPTAAAAAAPPATHTATRAVTVMPSATAPPTLTPSPTHTATLTQITRPTNTPSATATPRPADTPTPEATFAPVTLAAEATVPPPEGQAIAAQEPTTVPEATVAPEVAATAEATATAELSPTPAPLPESQGQPRFPRLVLANYLAWFDDSGWDACNISNGDKPLQPYNSDDPAAIARHVQMAIANGIDGFTLHWFAQGDRTDRNFATLLGQSQGTSLQSTVMFLRHIWPGSPAPTQDNVIEALRYIMGQYSGHPSFLHLAGKPVLFFTDIYRVPLGPGQGPVDSWAAIRAQVDPNRDAWWIAEGLDPSYLAIFDGLYVYKVTHAAYPNDYLKDSRWAGWVRQWEQNTGRTKLWVATIVPGYDDLRAGCRPDVRVPSAPHRQDRQDGAFYQATFAAAMESNPDVLFVQSFNEWVEGTYVEPSVQYGDRYLQLTRDFAAQFKG